MINTHTSVPEIIEHLNPVTEQFGPVSKNSGQIQIPTARNIRNYAHKFLAKARHAISDIASD
jgi:hypothetical protein